jgi:hypothetical protein
MKTSRRLMNEALKDIPEICGCVLCKEWMPVSETRVAIVIVDGPYGEESVKACAMCGDKYGQLDYDTGQYLRPKIAKRQKCCFCDKPADMDRGDPGFPVPTCTACDDELTAWRERTQEPVVYYEACHLCGARNDTVFDARFDDHLPMAGNWCRECEIDFETGVHNAGPSHERWAAYEARKEAS